MAFHGEALWIRLLYSPKTCTVMCCLSIPYVVWCTTDSCTACCMAWCWPGHKCKIYFESQNTGKTNKNKRSSLRFSLPLHSSRPHCMDPVHREQQRHRVDADGLPLGCGELARGENMGNAPWTKCCGTHHIMQGSLVPRWDLSRGHFNPTRSTWACGPGFLWLVYMQAVRRLRISWEYQE